MALRHFGIKRDSIPAEKRLAIGGLHYVEMDHKLGCTPRTYARKAG